MLDFLEIDDEYKSNINKPMEWERLKSNTAPSLKINVGYDNTFRIDLSKVSCLPKALFTFGDEINPDYDVYPEEGDLSDNEERLTETYVEFVIWNTTVEDDEIKVIPETDASIVRITNDEWKFQFAKPYLLTIDAETTKKIKDKAVYEFDKVVKYLRENRPESRTKLSATGPINLIKGAFSN